jgi:hypothetical protein
MTTDGAVRVLAVIGGGVGGGLLLGLLAQLLMRALTIRNVPRWPYMMVRLLGGLICGWLVALWLFGGGGSGIGGSGGMGFGSGAGSGDSKKEGPNAQKQNGDNKATDGETLRIEVLGADALKNADKDASHCYRLDQRDGAIFLTFEEVKEEIVQRQKQEPSLQRIEIVLYKDSPNDDRTVVSQLKDWSVERKLVVKVAKLTADAPR